MTPSISAAEFAVLAKQSGLPLTEAQRATLYEAYGHLEQMVERVHKALPREAEPALTFRPELSR
jgi:hypothetical protein